MPCSSFEDLAALLKENHEATSSRLDAIEREIKMLRLRRNTEASMTRNSSFGDVLMADEAQPLLEGEGGARSSSPGPELISQSPQGPPGNNTPPQSEGTPFPQRPDSPAGGRSGTPTGGRSGLPGLNLSPSGVLSMSPSLRRNGSVGNGLDGLGGQLLGSSNSLTSLSPSGSVSGMGSAPPMRPPSDSGRDSAMTPTSASWLGASGDEVHDDDDELHRMLVELKAAQATARDRDKTKRDLERRRVCVFPPDAPFMPFWNGLLALLVCLSGISVPVQLAFEAEFDTIIWTVMSYFMDICFIIDIFVQFRTGYLQEGTLIMDPRLIERRYLRSGWFFLDFLAGFPVLLVMDLHKELSGQDDSGDGQSLAQLTKTTKIFRIFRVLRVFRLVKLNRLFAILEQNLKMNPSMVRLLKYFFSFIMLWHWVGCLWLFIFQMERDDHALRDTNMWIPPPYIRGDPILCTRPNEPLFCVPRGGCFEPDGCEYPLEKGQCSWEASVCSVAPAPNFHQWTYSIFWAMAVTLGIGMDILPHTILEAGFSILVSAIGMFMFAFIVGSASSSLATMDAMAQAQRNRVDTVQHYMRYKKVPMRLQRQVNAYYTYLWTCMRGLDEADVMGSLPLTLRRQLAIALNRKLFLKVELFRKCDTHAILALAERLTPSIAVPREYVLRQGDPVDALYFISRGTVTVLKHIDSEPDDGAPAASPLVRANSFLVPTAEQVRHAPPPPGASSEAPKGLGAKRPSWCGGFACRPSSPEPTPRRDAAIAEKGQGTDEGASAPSSARDFSFVAALPHNSLAATEEEKPAASGDAHRRGNGGFSFAPCKNVSGTNRGSTSPNPTPPGMSWRRASVFGRRVTPVSEQHYVTKTQLGEYDTFGEEGFLSQLPSPVSVRAESYLDMMLLTELAFNDVSRRFPQLADLLQGDRQRARRTHGLLRSAATKIKNQIKVSKAFESVGEASARVGTCRPGLFRGYRLPGPF